MVLIYIICYVMSSRKYYYYWRPIGDLAERSEAMQSVTRMSNDMDTHIGGTSIGDAEKAGWKANSVQSIENRQLYETEEEKSQLICESFNLDTNEILNAMQS